MKALRFGSVCSGIEAASVAWGPLGWEAAWFSEIEPFPCAVLAHHYPDVPNLGDMTKLPEMIASHKVEAPDLFCGGTPCQAFSVAGLRQSLADDRGNLSLTFVEIANAIDDVRRARGEPESIVFWENVPGVLSTKDNAFGCFLGALAGSDSALVPIDRWTDSGVVAGPKRTVAWRTLDAQYFGLAQRRRRVFVVASARDGFDPAAVLLEWEGLRRDTAPSRETRKVTPTLSASGTGVSRVGFNCEDEWFIPTQPISIHPHCIGRAPDAGPQGKEYLIDGSAYCMDSRGQPQAVAQPMVTKPLPHTFKIRQGSEGGGKGYLGQDDKAFTISTNQDQYLAQPMVLMDQGGSVMNVEHDITGTLRRETHGHEPIVMQPIGVDIFNAAFSGDVAVPLTNRSDGTGTGPTVMQPIPLDLRNAGRDPEKHDEMNRQGVGIGTPGEPAHTVTSAFVHGVAQPVAVGTDCYNGSITGDISMTLKRGDGNPSINQPTVLQAMQVRRLTPVECERLQGFPDNYTNIKPNCPDGPRYKALGNSWAVPVVRWIGDRIAKNLGDRPPC